MLKALGGFASTGGGGGVGAVTYKGTWNASTNTPTLASGTGTQGDYYVVSTAGSTDLDGITDWAIGDWAIFNGTVWEKVDNTDAVSSVNGQVGTVVLDYDDVGAPSNTGASASGTWGINVTGSAGSASNVNVDIEVANVSLFPVLVSSSGIGRLKIDGGNNLRYNPSTDTLTIPYISGTNVAVTTVTATNVNATNFTGDLTGDVTGNVTASNISAANVTVTANLFANLATSNSAAMPDPSLPLNPEGYVEIVVNGTTKKIPYYGV